MRRLTFPGDDEGKLFANVYSVFRLGERYLQGVKAIRSALKVYDALDGISEEVTENPAFQNRRARDGPQIVMLEDEDYEVLKQCVVTVLDRGFNAQTGVTGIAQRVMGARAAAAVIDFIDGAATA